MTPEIVNTREQLRPESIRELMSSRGPCITIIPDVNVPGRHALDAVRAQLRERGEALPDLLAPVAELMREISGDTDGRSPVAIFRSPDLLLVVNIDPGLTPVSEVTDQFNLRRLLSIQASRNRFYILALSQNRTRLLECTTHASRELPFPPGFPTSLEEAMQTRQPDHVLDNRHSAGPSTGSMKGVMFGTSSDRDDKDEYLLHFMQEIDKAVNSVLKSGNDPLVVAAVEHELALYKRVNSYGRLIEPGVHGAPDGLEGGEMHKRALALLASVPPEPAGQLLQDFDKKVGTGLASTHIHEIVTASYEGRASHIFFQENAHYAGTFDPVRQKVKHTDDPLDRPADLIDDAALQTILHGGEAYLIPGSAIPNGAPVCALFRYPTPSNPQS